MVGISDDASNEEALDFARRHGLALVPVRRAAAGGEWYGYVRVVDLSLHNKPLQELVRPFLTLDVSAGKLEAILALRNAGAEYAAIYREAKLLGLVTSGALVEEFFISQQTAGR